MDKADVIFGVAIFLILTGGIATIVLIERNASRVTAEKESTRTTLQFVADQWDGGDNADEFGAKDVWGTPVAAEVHRGIIYSKLEVRSAGPDGMFDNSDDVVVTRRIKHGSIRKEVEKTIEGATRGAAKGAVTGVKEGLKQ